jgi:hypothetical protein
LGGGLIEEQLCQLLGLRQVAGRFAAPVDGVADRDASGAVNTVRQVGGWLGTALLNTLRPRWRQPSLPRT